MRNTTRSRVDAGSTHTLLRPAQAAKAVKTVTMSTSAAPAPERGGRRDRRRVGKCTALLPRGPPKCPASPGWSRRSALPLRGLRLRRRAVAQELAALAIEREHPVDRD